MQFAYKYFGNVRYQTKLLKARYKNEFSLPNYGALD